MECRHKQLNGNETKEADFTKEIIAGFHNKNLVKWWPTKQRKKKKKELRVAGQKKISSNGGGAAKAAGTAGLARADPWYVLSPAS